ncbi:hypothetical protein SAMN05421805_103212 [Saccharopolyspora antimicrobica]|uniref:Proteins of 100 residues with WXG n=2 Tax=Saccharopolyspora antimicrobica TaxID=455193 RepID=A0A1I4X462_9PSEU|nr:hypothetical protein ATL45_2596 [Saccharopolyspora antimicrobica]SFN20196.1 hypothetical protein SAMN05421805_103212 [Saccharopolyspora antimicrobica]
MPVSEDLIGPLGQAFNGLEEKTQESVDRFNAAVAHINEWGFILGPLVASIEPAIEFIRAKLSELVKLVRTAVEHHTPVVSLIVQSFSWTENVQKPVNNLTHTFGNRLYDWEGKASSAYKDKAGKQNEAIGAVANKADQVGRWLIDIAQYNVDYMAELAKMVTGFLGALVTASLETSTVVNIPFAVSDLAGAVGDVVAKSLDNLVGIAKRFVAALSKVRDLISYMTDQKLPRGHWPQAVEG